MYANARNTNAIAVQHVQIMYIKQHIRTTQGKDNQFIKNFIID